jgi:hypothetical protein
MSNLTIIFIILIIIFNLSAKNFMCFNLKKNYDFSLIVIIIFLKFINGNNNNNNNNFTF